MSNLLNKFISVKRDVTPAMSQLMRPTTKKASTSEDVSSDEQSEDIVVTKVTNDGKRKANQVEVMHATDSYDDEEEVQITKVEKVRIKRRKVPEEVRIVRVTPPKSQKYKHMTKEELFGDENEGFESDADKVDYYVIHSMCRRDGGNILTYVPGYTALWCCPEYMKTMHQTLYHEVNVWCKEVRKFIHRLDNEWDEDPAFDTQSEKNQKEHILSIVNRMETTVLKKILRFNSVVIHTLCFTSIMTAFPGCGKRLAKLIKYMCRSKSYHIRYFPVVDGKVCSYDIGTLLSIGHEWHFEQWDDEDTKEE